MQYVFSKTQLSLRENTYYVEDTKIYITAYSLFRSRIVCFMLSK
jgi:hypothetical protein